MIFYALGSFSIVLFNIILWAVILKKQGRDDVIWSYMLWSASVSGWAFGYGITLSGWFSYSATLFWNRFCHANASFIGIFFLQLTYALTGQLKEKRKQLILWYLVGVSLLVLDCTPYFVKGLWEMGIFKYQPLGGSCYIYFTAVFFSTTTYSLFTLFKSMRKSKNSTKGQIRIFLIGTIIGYTGGANLFLQAFGLNVLPIGVFFISTYVIFTGYAIYKYGFMDVRIIAANAVLFAFIYVPFLSVPFFVGYYFKNLSWAVPTFLEIMFVPLGLFVYQYLQVQAEKYILRTEYRQAAAIRDLAGGLVRLDDILELGKAVVGGLEKITGVENISTYLLDENRTGYYLSHFCGELKMSGEIAPNGTLAEYLKGHEGPVVLSESGDKPGKTVQTLLENKIIVAVPVIETGDLLGVIFLGEKSDGRAYSQIEITALDVLSKQVAFSVQMIQFIEEKEEIQRARNEVQRMKEFEYLTSAIGHEIGNGIQAIEVASSMLIRQKGLKDIFEEHKSAGEAIRKQVTLIRDNVENVRQVSEALRGYIRKGDVGEMTETELHDLVERVIVLLKVRNRGMKEMDIYMTGEAKIVCNAAAMQAVFYNLINNSYDAVIQESDSRKSKDAHSDYRGSIKIDIRQGGGLTEVYVRDNGMGMSEGVRRQIFTPLFTTKSHESQKDKRLSGGTGIGMFTIQKMLASHKGTIEIIKTAEHAGTEFLITVRSAGL